MTLPGQRTKNAPADRPVRTLGSSPVNPAILAIWEELCHQAAMWVGPPVGDRLVPLSAGSHGLFTYFWQNPGNLKFNYKTYNWIASNLSAGADPAELDTGFFTNLFIDVLSKVKYSLSTADQARLADAYRNAAAQQLRLLNEWWAVFKSFPSGPTPIDAVLAQIALTWAAPPTTVLAMRWNSHVQELLNRVPPGGEVLVPLVQAFLASLDAAVPLQNATTMYPAYLAAALDAVQFPTAANGGLETDNPDDRIVPAFGVTTPVEAIVRGLAETSHRVSVTLTGIGETKGQGSIVLSDGTIFPVTLSQVLSGGVPGRPNLLAEALLDVNELKSIEITFTGVTAVSFGPTRFDQASDSGWYWMDPITQAKSNGDRDVSGYEFSPTPHIDFSRNGPFGYVTGLVIANAPTIEIKGAAADVGRMAATLHGLPSLAVSLFGQPASPMTGPAYRCGAVVAGNEATASLTLAPVTRLAYADAAVPEDSVAYVLGGDLMYPAAD